MNEPASATWGAAQGAGLGFLKKHLREYSMLLALVAIMAFFQIATNGALLSPLNLTNLILQNSYIIIMSLGMLLVIVSGHIDLSVGSVAGFIGAFAAVMIVQMGIPWPVAFVLALVGGGLIGAAQGACVAFFKVPSFIATLAGMLVFRGLALTILEGRSVGPFPVSFQRLSSGFLPDVFDIEGLHVLTILLAVVVAGMMLQGAWRERQERVRHEVEDEPVFVFVVRNLMIAGVLVYIAWLMAQWRGLPNVLVIMGLLIAFYTFVTQRTTIGRRIYALGGNEKAARLSGIKTDRLTFFTFVNMGVLAALAGLIFTARLNTATPKAGVNFELDVIAACFIGGASASGGVGKVTGAVIGAFIMGVMNNGMSILGIGIDWQQVIKGLVLLLAVLFDVYNRNKA